MDLAPTIMHYLSAAVPHDCDGQILKNFFKKNSDFFISKPMQKKYGFKEERPYSEQTGKGDDEIKKRLKNLGYI